VRRILDAGGAEINAYFEASQPAKASEIQMCPSVSVPGPGERSAPPTGGSRLLGLAIAEMRQRHDAAARIVARDVHRNPPR
jgi:hypothetical protein